MINDLLYAVVIILAVLLLWNAIEQVAWWLHKRRVMRDAQRRFRKAVEMDKS